MAEGFGYGEHNIMQPKDLAQEMTDVLDNLALVVVFKNEIIKSLAH